MSNNDKYTLLKPSYFYVGLFILLAVLAYSKLFSAHFISWDDGDVLTNNKAVHYFDIKAFFTNYYVGNYAPLTMIGFAFDWLIFKGNAAGHHAVNIIFHLINSCLVYYLTNLLFKNRLKGLLCAIIFCFHPLQVETVAWVSAKNNLLYGLFFLMGMIYYSKYIVEKQIKHYRYTLVCFVLSVLSKPSAICFPLVLPLIDYLLHHKINFKSLIFNKIPFFLIALAFGITTIYTRTEDKFINQNHAFAIHERIGYAGYALLQYLCKFFAPFNLSVIYPYPQAKIMSILIGYFVVTILAIIGYWLFVSKRKFILFGLLFFITNLLLVLQFIPFGEVLTADRYMYLPILGVSFALLSLLSFKELTFKIFATLLVLFLGSLTFMRSSVWKNSITLYSDILNKYPHSFVALNSLGAEYMLNQNYDMALQYLKAAINENTNYYKGYYNRGLLFAQTGRMKDALNDFDKAIALKQYSKAYVARANVFYTLKKFDKAIEDAETVLKLEPTNFKANYVLANCYDDLNQLDKALSLYNKVIISDSENPLYYLRRAILYGKQQNMSSCLKDLDICTELNPDFAEAYYWKGVAKVNLKQNPCEEFKKAVALGFNAAQQPLMTYCR